MVQTRCLRGRRPPPASTLETALLALISCEINRHTHSLLARRLPFCGQRQGKSPKGLPLLAEGLIPRKGTAKQGLCWDPASALSSQDQPLSCPGTTVLTSPGALLASLGRHHLLWNEGPPLGHALRSHHPHHENSRRRVPGPSQREAGLPPEPGRLRRDTPAPATVSNPRHAGPQTWPDQVSLEVLKQSRANTLRRAGRPLTRATAQKWQCQSAVRRGLQTCQARQ